MENNLVKTNDNFMNEAQHNVVCTKVINSVEDGKELYNALEECDALLNDMVGKKIKIKDFYIERRDYVDEDTGTVRDKFRTIIFATDGKSYATGSYGVYNSLVKLCNIFGNPTWDEGIEVEIIKKTFDKKTSLTLKVC